MLHILYGEVNQFLYGEVNQLGVVVIIVIVVSPNPATPKLKRLNLRELL
jgi:hypothetical protein